MRFKNWFPRILLSSFLNQKNGIDCPEAKLDQVWKLTGGMGGENKPNRELAFGKYSSDTTDNANPTQ